MEREMCKIDFKKLVGAADVGDKESMEYAKEIFANECQKRMLKAELTKAFVLAEDKNRVVETLKMNSKLYALIRQHLPEEFDPVCKRVELLKGYVGDLWTAMILIDNHLSADEIEVGSISVEDEESGKAGNLRLEKI